MPKILSVDFDFWVRTDNQDLLDWSHKEAMFWIDTIWQIRASDAWRRGMDPREQTLITPDEPDPKMLGPWLVERGITVAANKIAIAESHAAIYPWLNRLRDIELVHIDAHHDMGYDDYGYMRRTNRGFKIVLPDVGCDNWIYRLIHEQRYSRIKSIKLIYPKWRKKNGGDMTKMVENRIEDWRKNGVEIDVCYGLEENMPRDVRFNKAFVCRSGAWVPPWLDEDFNTMVASLMTFSGHSRMTMYNYPNYEDMFKRSVDMEAAKASGEEMRAAYQKVQEAHNGQASPVAV